MASWDRPRGGGDSGGDSGSDKPPVPKPSYEPPVHPPAGGSREQSEGTTQNNGTRPKDKQPAPGDVGDQQRRPGDTSRETDNGTDKNAERNGYSALFEKQDQLIAGQEQQIARLRSDLGKRDSTIERLKEENDHQAETIEGLESQVADLKAGSRSSEGTTPTKKEGRNQGEVTEDAKKIEQLENEVAEGAAERRDLVKTISRQGRTIERLETGNDELRDEVAQLRAKLDAAVKGNGQPAERGDQQAGDSQAAERRAAKRTGTAEKDDAAAETRQKRIHLPGDRATAAITGLIGAVDAAGAGLHVLTSSETTMIGAGAAAAVALYLWGKSKHDERQEREKNADRPGN